jgi:hypothetical protein
MLYFVSTKLATWLLTKWREYSTEYLVRIHIMRGAGVRGKLPCYSPHYIFS